MALAVLLVNPVVALSGAGPLAEGSRPLVLTVFGDSLTAGLGLPADQAFPARLQARLVQKGYSVETLNAGVSGDTTAGGLSRLEWTLEQNRPDALILALGANDMLRALDPKLTRGNLEAMLEILKKHDIPVLLAGMRSFRNLGAVFGDSYQDMYEDLADDYDAVYYPFFLEGVATDAALNQDDGLHPNASGVEKMVDNILPDVMELLEKASK